jgi:hypothetical protein
VRLTGALGVAALGLVACGGGPRREAASPPPFIPIERQYLPTPENVEPAFPTFAVDGSDVYFLNVRDKAVYVVRPDGTDLRCIDCGFPDRPPSGSGIIFLYPFADGQRLMLARGLGKRGGGTSGADADAWILECAPSIRDCASHRFLDVDMSADQGPHALVHRRFWHLAPDEVHLGWMNVRADGTVLVVGRMERRADRYVVVDPRAVNPPGPVDGTDKNADRWEDLSQLYELKDFSPDGKSVLAVGLPGNNIDVIQIDLASGSHRRLTANRDWDEDGSLSPDQQLYVVNSWRGRNRFDVFAWIPQIRGFTGLTLGAALATHYVSTWTGFQCNLSPWLLPATGDEGGSLMGQPIDVYGDGLTASDNVVGRYVWSPDSTQVLLTEKTRTPPPGQQIPNRLAIARLSRTPTNAVPASPSTVGSWAPPAAQYAGPLATGRTIGVSGDRGGHATITYSGSLGHNAATKVVYEGFTDDGETFVDGTIDISSLDQRWKLSGYVTVSGAHTGRLEMDLTLDNAAKLPVKQGTISAVYDGKVAPPLPDLGPCYDKLPRASPLSLKVTRKGRRIQAIVTADVYGDVRPVAGAVVRAGSSSARTDGNGVATITLMKRDGNVEITATAGDTFVAATQMLPWRDER